VTALTKNDLINAVAAHGLSKRQSASVVESLFDIIFRCFEKSEDVKIVGFGHFPHPAEGVAPWTQSADGGQHRDHRAQGADVQAEQGPQAADQPAVVRPEA
jgi:Bacterial nucleoid DNA-binding protein